MDPQEELRQLFADNYQKILSYALRRCSSPDAADDLVGDVFLTAWRRIDDVRAIENPLPWLYGVAGNVLRNQRRSNVRQLNVKAKMRQNIVSEPSFVDDELDTSELMEALSQLPFDDQEILRLCTWESLSHKEIAVVLECSSNAVGLRIHRAKAKLRNLLKSDKLRPQIDIEEKKAGLS